MLSPAQASVRATTRWAAATLIEHPFLRMATLDHAGPRRDSVEGVIA